MTPWTIFRLLIGRRDAILTVASSRWSLLVGAILVLSGSLARNYDGVCLPEEWPALAHGLVVSTVNALLLFSIVFFASKASRRGMAFRSGYLSFLALFWMTAPMAWLYGIPYERWLSPLDALHANAWTLLVVSIWRVLLISRVLAVLFAERTHRVLWLVLLFADVTLLLALLFAPLPVIDFMGGMQQSPEERELGSLAFLAGFGAFVTLFVWVVGAITAMTFMKNQGAIAVPSNSRTPPRAALVFACIALLAWCGAALWTHSEQRNRYEAERLLTTGKIEDALARMSEHSRADYPPVWDPPPRPAWGVNQPAIADVRAALIAQPHAGWVESLFWEKCWRDLNRGGRMFDTPPSQWTAYAEAEFLGDDWWKAVRLHAKHDVRLSAEDRAALNAAVDARDAYRRAQQPAVQP